MSSLFKNCNYRFNFLNIFKFSDTLPQNNSTRQYSYNTKENLNPYWVTGFTDAEGCFTVILSKRSELSNSWKVTTSFEINLHIKDLDILLRIKDFFGVGIVSSRPDKFTCVYRVTKNEDLSLCDSLCDLNIIIPHFINYPLISQKYSDFFLWTKVVDLIKNKEHLTDLGFEKVLIFYSSINTGASSKVLNQFPGITKAERPLLNLPLFLNPYWVSGFSADECGFSIGIRANTNQIYFRFHIAQHSRDIELMKLLITYFNCGKVNVRNNRCDYYVQNMKKITENILPLRFAAWILPFRKYKKFRLFRFC